MRNNKSISNNSSTNYEIENSLVFVADNEKRYQFELQSYSSNNDSSNRADNESSSVELYTISFVYFFCPMNFRQY